LNLAMILQDIAASFGEDVHPCPCSYDIPELKAQVVLLKGRKSKYIGLRAGEPLSVLRPLYTQHSEGQFFGLYPFDLPSYRFLSAFLPYLRPQPFDSRPSFGCGDRLGMVSAAQIKALEQFPVFPVLAQQSPRELEKTHRTFAAVLLDAVWGILESGYQGSFGADADHIKDERYLCEARDAGFTVYTLDLSEDVDHGIFSESVPLLQERFQASLSCVRELFKRYAGKQYTLGPDITVDLSEEKLLPIVLAYLPAIEKVERFHALLRESLGSSFSLEISLDEGEKVTSPEVHFFIAEELHRRGIDFQSLAPRFPGSFEKGIDYIGSTEEFARALRSHVTIQKNLGGYRLSLHSGSDKFSIYPIFFQETEGFFHLKTSGTSWLVALETIAEVKPELFFRVYRVAYETFEENLKAYRISVRKEELPVTPENVMEADLQQLFAHPGVRQFLHIAYGSVLDALGEELREALAQAEVRHYEKVEENLRKHLLVLFGKRF